MFSSIFQRGVFARRATALDPRETCLQPRPVRHHNQHPHPAGHLLLPAAAIGGLSLALAAGLELAGALSRLNGMAAAMCSRGGLETFPKQIPVWMIWLAVVICAFGISLAMLGTPGLLRRVLLWLTAVLLIAAWAPVLSLAAHAPDIAGPWIATVWSGICALVYSSRHRMPCDETPPPSQ